MRRVGDKEARGILRRSWIADVIEKIKEWLTIPVPVPVQVPAASPKSR